MNTQSVSGLASVRSLPSVPSDCGDACGRGEPLNFDGEERLRLALHASATGWYDWDFVADVLTTDARAKQHIGLSPEVSLTFPLVLEQLVPEDRPRLQQRLAEILAVPGDNEIEFRVVWPDGSLHWILLRGRAFHSPSGKPLRVMGITMDVTERKLAEQRVQQAAERMAILSDVASQLLASDRPQELVQSLCQRVMEHLDCQMFSNFLAEERHYRLHLHAHAGIPPETAKQIEWLDFGAGICGEVAQSGRPVIEENILRLPDPRSALLRQLGIDIYVVHPLMNQGRMIGTLGFGSRTRGRFSDEEMGLMRAVADLVAMAIQRIRLMESVEEQAAQAHAANEAKGRFLANVSHELRTPMSAVLGMTELALEEPLSPPVREYLQTAKASADSLLGLLNDILDFSRMAAGKFTLEARPFRLREMLEDTLRAMAVRAAEKGLELVCDVSDDVPDSLVGDSLRVRQIITNLLGNAIKFTKQGEVVLGVTTIPYPNHHGQEVVLQFTVTDTGIGIPPEEQEKIFAPFIQAQSTSCHEYGGTGLGLAITSNLVNMMRGRIWLDSQIGRGTTFYFTLRLDGQPPATDTEEPVVGEAALRDLSVLVVEDNANCRRILERTLCGWSMQPTVVDCAAAALARLDEMTAKGRAFSLVLLDTELPDRDGLALAEHILAGEAIGPPRLILASCAGRQAVLRRCQNLPIGGFLDKPIFPAQLRWAVLEALGIVARPAEPSCQTDSPAPLTAPRHLSILLAEDTPANQKLVVRILSNRGHTVELAGNGREAVEKLQQGHFDLVLMDVQMPLMDGFDATVAIRDLDDPQRRAVPIVAMTAHAMKGDEERCLASGMDAYISKPLNRRELVELVERLAAPAACPIGSA